MKTRGESTVTERLCIIETNVKNIDAKIDDHIDTQRKDFDRVFEMLENIDNKYAGKWVEKVSIGLIASGTVALIVFILSSLR